MKKLINDPQNVVCESLAGLALAHADILRVHYDPNHVVRAEAPLLGKVGVVFSAMEQALQAGGGLPAILQAGSAAAEAGLQARPRPPA